MLSTEIGAQELVEITGGVWEARPAFGWKFRGVCFDPAKYREGQMVICLTQHFRYGVDFHEIKVRMGRSGLILPSGVATPGLSYPRLRVADVRQALARLAQAVGARCATSVIAVTGSVGKTSSCHLLQHVLSPRGAIAFNGQKNYYDGVLAELTNLSAADFAILETSLGALNDGISNVLRPDVSLLTHVSPVHATQRIDMMSLADGKAQVFEGLKSTGTAVINRDAPYFERIRAVADARSASVITFGEHPESDFRLLDYQSDRKSVVASIHGKHQKYELGLLGRHMALNSLGVLAICEAVGVPLENLRDLLRSALPVQGRGSTEELTIGGKRVTLLDESYNASPASMAAAFQTLAGIGSTGGRRIAVLGDMLELGADSARYHADLLPPLLASGVSKAFLVGEAMRDLWRQLPVDLRGAHALTTDKILGDLGRELQDGDVILVKGSHSTGLHKLTADIRFLSFLPYALRGEDCGVKLYLALRQALKRAAPWAPLSATRWVSWQFRKLVKAE